MNFFSHYRLSVPIVVLLLLSMLEIPGWLSLLLLTFLLLRVLLDFSFLKKVPMSAIYTIALLAFALIYFEYRTFFTIQAGFALFLSYMGLRLIQFSTAADHRFMSLMGIGTFPLLFLFQIDIWVFLIGITAVLSLWLHLFEQSISQKPDLRIFRRAVLGAAPIAGILFFIFPRVQNPFSSRAAMAGSSGFSDQLNPGAISDLALSKDPVFRVYFSQTPRIEQMYFRGEVLSKNLGLTWGKTNIPDDDKIASSNALATRRLQSYSIVIEGSSKPWVFTLDNTIRLWSDQFQVYARPGGIYRSAAPLYKRAQYFGDVNPDLKRTVETVDPYLDSPKWSAALTPLLNSIGSTATIKASQVNENILAYFQKNRFRYSLRNLKKGISLEDFLLREKQGFCEHFAASHAALLRAAGVPSRVLVGYQGGQWNPFGNYLLITQQDAHAWVEYLDEDKVWNRVDPVDAIAPLRLDLGSEVFFSLDESLQGTSELSPEKLADALYWFRLREKAFGFFDNINTQWVLFLVEFDLSAQRDLLLNSQNAVRVGVLALFGAVLIVTVLMVMRKRGIIFTQRSEAMRAYLKLLRWGEKMRLRKPHHQGPQDYAAVLSRAFPERADEFSKIINEYVTERFDRD